MKKSKNLNKFFQKHLSVLKQAPQGEGKCLIVAAMFLFDSFWQSELQLSISISTHVEMEMYSGHWIRIF